MPTNLRLYDGYDNRPELKDEVYQLQQKLANQGYPLEPDGEFGPGTEKVVKQFQKDHLLNADGIVGVDTWDALNQQAEDTTKPVSQGASATLTTDMLKAIMPSGKTSQLELFCPALNRQLVTYQLQSPLRQAHFLAQVAHESGSFNYTSENLNYSASAIVARTHIFVDGQRAGPTDRSDPRSRGRRRIGLPGPGGAVVAPTLADAGTVAAVRLRRHGGHRGVRSERVQSHRRLPGCDDLCVADGVRGLFPLGSVPGLHLDRGSGGGRGAVRPAGP